jgi:hypothetical protein
MAPCPAGCASAAACPSSAEATSAAAKFLVARIFLPISLTQKRLAAPDPGPDAADFAATR